MNPMFFEALLNTKEFRKVVYRMAYGVALKHVSISKLKQIPIIVPSLDLQKRYVEITEAINLIRLIQEKSRHNIDDLESVLVYKFLEAKTLC
jgi:restriction endonuclease S subunit